MIKPASPENINHAAELLNSGELIAFPTETVYGLGANALDVSAVNKIYKLKNRPATNPLILHLLGLESIAKISPALEIDGIRQRLIALSDFWPGPLSIVIPKRDVISDIISAGLPNIAVRIPSNTIALQLLKACKLPIAAPSANKHTYVSPTTAEHVLAEFGSQSPLILDGGPCTLGLESTIISIVDNKPLLLRPGSITLEQLEDKLGEKVDELNDKKPSPAAEQLSPGLGKLHYSPKTPLKLINQVDITTLPTNSALLTFKPFITDKDINIKHIRCLSAAGNLEEVAHNLFAAIRELDQLKLDLIVVDVCSTEGLGRAIMDRLKRATQRC